MQTWVLLITLISANGEKREISLEGFETQEQCFKANLKMTRTVLDVAPWVESTENSCKESNTRG